MSDSTKFKRWSDLVSVRGSIEVKLLEAAEMYLDGFELEILNTLLLEKNYKWAGYVFEILSKKANLGYKEMHEIKP